MLYSTVLSLLSQQKERYQRLYSTTALLLIGILVWQWLLATPPAYCKIENKYPHPPLSLSTIEKELTKAHPGKSGAYIFEKGEEALLARAWLTDHAVSTIDVQYFIWSSDNIGILAAEALLRAAERGVRVRVLVDDLLIDAPDAMMIALNDHANISIRIYNPKHSVGTGKIKRLFNIALKFRSVNQRMHDKTFTVDGSVAITGGRNMADEYFDYNRTYNFRDRDILLLGPVVQSVQKNFDQFWVSKHSVPLETLLKKAETKPGKAPETYYSELHSYASNPENFKPEVWQALHDLHNTFSHLQEALVWDEIHFIHDIPGKNRSNSLGGGGQSTKALIEALAEAEQSIIIQSPYLVMPKGAIPFFKRLIDKGVRVTISTNSLASTDNLQAFSGYLKQRKKILDAGIDIFEYRPDPAVQQDLIERYALIEKEVPTFAIHAKSMVIDHNLVYVGTFNLDPRSANLNTEVGVLIRNTILASRIEKSILTDILPENSWNTRLDKPDRHASWGKRIKVFFWKLFPLEPIL